jgi:hypothetical protein
VRSEEPTHFVFAVAVAVVFAVAFVFAVAVAVAVAVVFAVAVAVAFVVVRSPSPNLKTSGAPSIAASRDGWDVSPLPAIASLLPLHVLAIASLLPLHVFLIVIPQCPALALTHPAKMESHARPHHPRL